MFWPARTRRARLDELLLPVLVLALVGAMPAAAATAVGPPGSGDAMHQARTALTSPASGSETLEPASLQAISGYVVKQIWALPVAGAQVVLTDAEAEEYRELRVVETDEEGFFHFQDVEPGVYLVQARRGGTFSALSPEVVTAEGEEAPEPLILEFPSRAVQEVSACFPEDAEEVGSVLLGVLFHAEGEVALPDTRLVLREADAPAGTEGWSAEVEADEGGRFYVCDVPAEVELTAWGYALGQVSRPVEGIVVEESSLTRADLPLEFEAGMDFGRTRIEVRGLEGTGAEGDPVTIVGRLLDGLTGEPVRGAIVRVVEQEREALSGEGGAFRLEDLEAGLWTLEVQHLGYGTQQVELELAAGTDAELDLRLSPRAVVLEGMEVTVRRGDVARRTPFTRPSHVLAGERIARLAEFGGNIVTAVNELGGGLRVSREGVMGPTGPTVCIESNRRILSFREDERRSGDFSPCDMVVVVVDGTVMHDAGDILAWLDLQEVESIEYLPPADAGMRYGIDAGTVGALEIWTRGRGPHRSPERDR